MDCFATLAVTRKDSSAIDAPPARDMTKKSQNEKRRALPRRLETIIAE
jgi:hypothetical protein